LNPLTSPAFDLLQLCRRAKRLKKLNRMMQSNAAQQASNAWRSRTLMLLGVVLVAHVVCFAVLTIEVDRRYTNAEAVSQIAEVLASSQQAALRANFMQVIAAQHEMAPLSFCWQCSCWISAARCTVG
jgi:hypothetical protein